MSLDGEEEILSEFYDHSFALHEGIHRSFLSDTRSTTDDSGFTASFEDEDSMSKPSQSSSTDKDYGDARCLHGHLSDVEDIPSATYLQSVAPRTVVVNLIVAIISIRQRRRVLTRWGHEMDIVELLLGDETKSGFRVSCWVQPSKDGTVPVPNSLDDSLRALRLRDVILLQFVALSCFRGQVYGQSLRQNMTKIHILDREVVSSPDGVDTGNTGSTVTLKRSDPQAMKVRRVRHWIRNFVAPGVGGNDLANDSFFVGPAAEAAELPPDTQ